MGWRYLSLNVAESALVGVSQILEGNAPMLIAIGVLAGVVAFGVGVAVLTVVVADVVADYIINMGAV